MRGNENGQKSRRPQVYPAGARWHLWITAYRDSTKREAGLFLSFTRGSIGQRASRKIAEEAEQEMLRDLAGDWFMRDWNGTRTFADKRHFGPLSDPAVQERALTWLATRTKDFVNVLKPPVRSAILDIKENEA